MRILELENLLLKKDTNTQTLAKELEEIRARTIDKTLHDKMITDLNFQKQTMESSLTASLEELKRSK
jgi:hypothetical protein